MFYSIEYIFLRGEAIKVKLSEKTKIKQSKIRVKNQKFIKIKQFNDHVKISNSNKFQKKFDKIFKL